MSQPSDTVLCVKSIAKQLLTLEIVAGEVTEQSDIDDVYCSCEEYQLYPKANFYTNMKKLIISQRIKEEKPVFEYEVMMRTFSSTSAHEPRISTLGHIRCFKATERRCQ
jgi:hypothetical protein